MTEMLFYKFAQVYYFQGKANQHFERTGAPQGGCSKRQSKGILFDRAQRQR